MSEETVVCTLFEKDFHYGLAALVNSLIHEGFRGLIVAGYRGDLPDWATALPGLADQRLPVSEGVSIRFVLLDTPIHFTHYKPTFFRSVVETYRPKQLFYFDPDIVLLAPWSFFQRWVQHGIALCQDVNWSMPANHPLKCEWKQQLSTMGYRITRETDAFYNAGFIGMRDDWFDFFTEWERLIHAVWNEEELKEFCPKTRSHRTQPFMAADQDCLNALLMATDAPLTTMGIDGMGFVPGGYTMVHALGLLKPWRKKYILSALEGIPPNRTDKVFWDVIQKGPIVPYSLKYLRSKSFDLAVGSVIGRFIRKN